jgi:hypothetical protein
MSKNVGLFIGDPDSHHEGGLGARPLTISGSLRVAMRSSGSKGQEAAPAYMTESLFMGDRKSGP